MFFIVSHFPVSILRFFFTLPQFCPRFPFFFLPACDNPANRFFRAPFLGSSGFSSCFLSYVLLLLPPCYMIFGDGFYCSSWFSPRFPAARSTCLTLPPFPSYALQIFGLLTLGPLLFSRWIPSFPFLQFPPFPVPFWRPPGSLHWSSTIGSLASWLTQAPWSLSTYLHLSSNYVLVDSFQHFMRGFGWIFFVFGCFLVLFYSLQRPRFSCFFLLSFFKDKGHLFRLPLLFFFLLTSPPLFQWWSPPDRVLCSFADAFAIRHFFFSPALCFFLPFSWHQTSFFFPFLRFPSGRLIPPPAGAGIFFLSFFSPLT